LSLDPQRPTLGSPAQELVDLLPGDESAVRLGEHRIEYHGLVGVGLLQRPGHETFLGLPLPPRSQPLDCTGSEVVHTCGARRNRDAVGVRRAEPPRGEVRHGCCLTEAPRARRATVRISDRFVPPDHRLAGRCRNGALATRHRVPVGRAWNTLPARLPALLTTMYVPSSRRTRLPVNAETRPGGSTRCFVNIRGHRHTARDLQAEREIPLPVDSDARTLVFFADWRHYTVTSTVTGAERGPSQPRRRSRCLVVRRGQCVARCV
jgi:hypothetical protein